MKNMAFSAIFIYFSLGVSGVASAEKPPPCYLVHASHGADGLELHFGDHNLFILVKKINGKDFDSNNRTYKQINGQMNRVYNGELGKNGEKDVPSEIVLSQSEEASVQSGPHDGCTIKYEEKKGGGVLIKYIVGLPGIEPEVSTAFFSINEINGNDK